MSTLHAYEKELERVSRTRFIIFDGHALIYRAYHAFPELTAPDGQLVNALYGFSRIMLTVIRDFEPAYIAVAFDHKGKTKRAQAFEQYKAHRPEMPDDLKLQIPLIKELVATLSIPTFEQEGVEADDLIGSIARLLSEQNKQLKHAEEGILTTVVSGDKDLLQLVTEDVSVWIPGNKWSKDTEYFAAEVVKKMGVTPTQVPDLKALMGDASDNIPGVAGIGKVTAQKIIEAFGSVEQLYDQVKKVTASETTHPLLKGAVLAKLLADEKMAYLSKELATIDTHVAVDFDLKKCVVTDYDKDAVAALFEKYDFKSLVQLLPSDAFEESVQAALF